jgi:hypothetical protein
LSYLFSSNPKRLNMITISVLVARPADRVLDTSSSQKVLYLWYVDIIKE